MSTRKIKLIAFFTIWATLSWAQKKPLTHDVYDDWKGIQSVNISNDGNWAGWRIAPQVGDATLEIRNLNNNQTIKIDRVSRYAFSHNSAFVVGEIKPAYEEERELKLKKTAASKMPKDSLFVLNLSSGDIQKFARVKSYDLPEESTEWMAWLHEKPLAEKKKPAKEEEKEVEAPEKSKKKKKNKKKEEEVEKEVETAEEPEDPRAKSKGTELVLFNMSTGEMSSFQGVMEYTMSKDGSYLFYEFDEVDSLNPSGVFAVNTEMGTPMQLSTGMTDYKKMSVSDKGNQMAFFATNSDKDEDDKVWSVMYWNGNGIANVLADSLTAGVPEGWMVSDNSRLQFSESGNRLYFGTAPEPMEYEYESDTTILKEERPQVDVWSYNDPYIQPMQKLQANREKNRTYQVVYDLQAGTLVQLEGNDLESVYIDTEHDMDFFIAMDDQRFRTQYTWDVQLPRDYYKVDAKTGEVEVLLESTVAFASLSPGGKYLNWFDQEDGNYYTMNVASGKITNLTADMPVSFADELHDSPSLAGSYGSPGWAPEDEAFYIYDRYDIWKFDPEGQQAAVNVTEGHGRANQMIYRYQRLDREEEYVNVDGKALLSVFNEWTKASGYAYGDMSQPATPSAIVMKDMSVYGLQKAKEADRVLVRMSTYEEYPEVYMANNLEMDGLKKLTDIDAQEDPYNWGSAELIEFASGYDGETMQAILYKPENFDPNKKYPMIVYFYERRSNSLHSHPSPAPSASTVNIPYFVSNDYLVLVPDIKYEDGHPGKSAMDHVVPATKAVMAKGFVNEDKMAIQGQSWGGYQVAYIVTQTDMYAAAGAGAPVSNMTSAYGGVRWGSGMSRMFQYEKTQSRIGGTLWDKFDLYVENSPLFGVPNIETPLFIMHNDADGAVPWYQGIEFYMALRRLQKPSWMVVYNDEAHNLTQRKNRKDLSMRMGQFFDHYLKDAPMPEWMAYGLPATLKGRTLRYELVDEETEEKIKEGESLKLEKGGGGK
ncbi:S9 family peptidase [Roseivirga sp.]|uniref:S9 family peptidase n=1 Tax=Roseivirga sp. TaxID=1964215 RepID=UPI003B5302F7